jgi:protein-S-isoprenylcysteine O-methyltransferase Ste14
MSLKKRAWLQTAVSIPVVYLLFFLPAGTFAYWQAWVLLAIMGVTGTVTSVYFWRRDPALLERRMRVAEQEPAQKLIVALLYSLLASIVVLSARDHRMHWSSDLPLLVILGDLLVIAGSFVYFIVFRENSFAGATIRVAADQKVVSTGPYSFVRHPLYDGLLLVCIGIPLALGSYWPLLLVIPIVVLVVLRLTNEEAVLLRDLPGYAEYRAKVRWRLIPGVY